MPRSISDTQILEAAMAVIAREGYAGATTREIAAAAGINEVTLFRRFGSKKKLLLAAVEQENENLVASGVGYTGNLARDLERIVRFYQDIMLNRGPLLMMLISEGPRQPELLEIVQTPFNVMRRIIAILARYQAEGALAAEDPRQAFLALVSPIFLGGVLAYLDPERPAIPMDPAGLVENYLRGRAR